MNRQERRAASRGKNRQMHSHGHELDCGCSTRMLEALTDVDCPHCGESMISAGEAFMMPTQSPVGSLMRMNAGCKCGWAEFEFTVAVVA